MSGDKLREQFEAWYEADSISSESNWFKRDDQYPDEYHHLATQMSWEGFQACVNIKDAEIEELKNKLSGQSVLLGIDKLAFNSYRREIEQLNAKIAGWKYNWQESTDREIELNKEIERLQNLLTHNVER